MLRTNILRRALFSTVPVVRQVAKPGALGVSYSPKVLSKFDAGKPVPVNIEALYNEPLKHEVKHKDLAAEVHFRSYGVQNLEFIVDFAMRAAYYLGIPITGPKPLPTKRERWTVIRAPFVHAKSKENFERSTHKRLLTAWDTDAEVIDIWLSVLNKYGIEGVGIKANVFVRESLDTLAELDSVSFAVDEQNPYLQTEAHDNKDLVAERVKELLNDPVFKQHLEGKIES